MGHEEVRATFILRLWRERTAPAGQWRGELVHVQAGRSERAADIVALLAAIRAELAQLEGQQALPETRNAPREGGF